jgi:hypothetical protein
MDEFIFPGPVSRIDVGDHEGGIQQHSLRLKQVALRSQEALTRCGPFLETR